MEYKRVRQQINIFDKLPEDIILKILKQAIEEQQTNFGSIRASCKILYMTSMKEEILKKIKCWSSYPRVCKLNIAGKNFLQHFIKVGSKEAMLLLGTHLFFNEQKREQGINLLKQSAEAFTIHGYYNYAIALIVMRRRRGAVILRTMLQQRETTKCTIKNCRAVLRRMWKEGSRECIPIRCSCFRQGHRHWNGMLPSIENDGEINLNCSKCGVDVEKVKLRFAIP